MGHRLNSKHLKWLELSGIPGVSVDCSGLLFAMAVLTQLEQEHDPRSGKANCPSAFPAIGCNEWFPNTLCVLPEQGPGAPSGSSQAHIGVCAPDDSFPFPAPAGTAILHRPQSSETRPIAAHGTLSPCPSLLGRQG